MSPSLGSLFKSGCSGDLKAFPLQGSAVIEFKWYESPSLGSLFKFICSADLKSKISILNFKDVRFNDISQPLGSLFKSVCLMDLKTFDCW